MAKVRQTDEKGNILFLPLPLAFSFCEFDE